MIKVYRRGRAGGLLPSGGNQSPQLSFQNWSLNLAYVKAVGSKQLDDILEVAEPTGTRQLKRSF